MFVSFIVTGIILVLIVGLMAIAIFTWPTSTTGGTLGSSTPLEPEFFIWTIGDATGHTFLPSPIWPYARSGNKAVITYSYRVPIQSSIPNPTSPVVVSLPVPASSLVGEVLGTSIEPNPPDTTLEVVQYTSTSVAFKFQPSGTYLLSSQLSSAWTAIFWVSLVVA